jgi:hypothetical protein
LSIVWFSSAQLNVLFPSLLNFSVPLLVLAVIWLLLDRNDGRCDILAGGCLAIALASGGIGLVTAGVVGVELLGLRAPIRRWLPFTVPFAAWCLWYIGYHTPVSNPNSIAGTIRFALHEIQATFAAFVGGWNPGGYVLLAAAVTLFGVAFVRWHTFDVRAGASLAGVVLFAALTGYTARRGTLPAVPATTPRYLWVNGFLILAAVVEVVRGRRAPQWVAAMATIIIAVGAVTLIGNLRTYHEQVVRYTHTARTFMVAVEAIPERINRRRIMPFSYNIVRVGDYLAAIRHLGSAVQGVGLGELGTEAERHAADGWMVQDLGLRLETTTAPPSSCRAIAAAGERDLALHGPANVRVAAGPNPAVLRIRRLARRFGSPLGTIAPGTDDLLRIPLDHFRVPWHLRIEGVGASVDVCREAL